MSAVKDIHNPAPDNVINWRNPKTDGRNFVSFPQHVIRVVDPANQIGELMDRYGDRVTAMSSRIVKNEQDGEEVALDTFLQLYGQLAEMNPGQEVNVSQRLVRILQSRSKDKLRAESTLKRGGDQEIISYDEHVGRNGKFSSTTSSAESAALAKIGVEDAVKKAYKEEPVVVYQALGYKIEEIVEGTGVAKSTVMWRAKKWREAQEEPDLS